MRTENRCRDANVLVASEELAIGNVRFTTFDLGGHQQGMDAFEAVRPGTSDGPFLGAWR